VVDDIQKALADVKAAQAAEDLKDLRDKIKVGVTYVLFQFAALLFGVDNMTSAAFSPGEDMHSRGHSHTHCFVPLFVCRRCRTPA
jgi:hypothetical protein